MPDSSVNIMRKIKLSIKNKYSLALILGLAGLFFFAFLRIETAVARVAWHRYGHPDIAMFFNRDDAKLAMEIGNYYFNGGAYDLAKADRAYQKALAIDPAILWGHYQRARIFFVRADFEHALKEINEELRVNPTNLRSLYVRGLIYGYRGNLTAAERDFRTFTKWAPKEWAGYNDLCWILLKEKKYKEARETAIQGIAMALKGDTNSWLWNSRGVAELNLDLLKEAKNSFEHALRLSDSLTLADWQRAYPGNGPGNAELGIKEFQQAIKINLERTH